MVANPGNGNIQVPGGKERDIDFLSSGERTGNSLNLGTQVPRGRGACDMSEGC